MCGVWRDPVLCCWVAQSLGCGVVTLCGAQCACMKAAGRLPRALHRDWPSSCLRCRTGAPAARPARRALKYSSPVRTAIPNPFLQLYALQEYQQHDRARRSLEYTIYDKELTKIKADIEKVGRGGIFCVHAMPPEGGAGWQSVRFMPPARGQPTSRSHSPALALYGRGSVAELPPAMH